MSCGKLLVGKLSLKSRVLLSPLEGVSDIGFRSLCFQNGAALTWTEMVRAAAITRNNAATLALIDTFDPNVPTGLQLLVKSSKELIEALTKLEHLANTNSQMKHFHNICAIDLNFGCPSRDIIQIGCGPAMLKRKTKLNEIFQALKMWKEHTTLQNIQAVGCKIRLGLNPSEQTNKVYLPIIEMANRTGLDYITVHARHGMQRSSLPAYWPAIKEIKSHATFPVIGNGDVWTRQDMIRMLQETGCDAVMIARSAIRNPWIFRDLATITHPITPINNNNTTDSTNSSSSSSSSSSSIPTVAEVDDALIAYQKHCELYGSKGKYEQFNTFNLQRIKESITAQRYDYPYKGPKTVHLS